MLLKAHRQKIETEEEHLKKDKKRQSLHTDSLGFNCLGKVNYCPHHSHKNGTDFPFL